MFQYNTQSSTPRQAILMVCSISTLAGRIAPACPSRSTGGAISGLGFRVLGFRGRCCKPPGALQQAISHGPGSPWLTRHLFPSLLLSLSPLLHTRDLKTPFTYSNQPTAPGAQWCTFAGTPAEPSGWHHCTQAHQAHPPNPRTQTPSALCEGSSSCGTTLERRQRPTSAGRWPTHAALGSSACLRR